MASNNNDSDVSLSMTKIFEAVPVVEKIMEFSMWNFRELENYKALKEVTLLGLSLARKRNLRISDVANLRLVNSNLFDTTTQILRSKRSPYFWIEGGPFLGLFLDDEKPEDNNIGAFVNLLTSKDNILYDDIPELEIPTFNLRLNFSYFTEDNHAVLSDCFLKLGSALVSLDFEFPFDCTMPMEFPPFSLPRLDKVKVELAECTTRRKPAFRMKNAPREGHNFLAFLQIILDASKDLRELTFHNDLAYEDFKYFPEEDSFKGLRIPDTLRKLEFGRWMTPLCLEMLMAPQNKLSQLTTLTLYHLDEEMTFSTDLLYDLFGKLSGTLKHLYVEGWPLGELNEAERTKLKFPLMPKLKSLLFRSGRWTLMDEKGNSLDQFPNLEILKLVDVLEDAFWRTWANDGKVEYGSLKKLNLPLLREEAENWDDKLERERYIYTNEHYHPRTQSYYSRVYTYERLTSGTLGLINQAFPNLTELYLTFLASPEVSGFAYLFGGKLNRLRKLEMIIYENHGEGGKQIPNEFWDSVLTGLSVERVQQLRQMTLEDMEGIAKETEATQVDGSGDGNGMEKTPSICNLTELRSLLLSYPKSILEVERTGATFVPIISNVAFLLGFLKMPKLEKLKFAGGFKASSEMEKKWKDLHGGDDKSIKYWFTRLFAEVMFH